MSATLRNKTGQKVGSIDPDGTIRNFTGQKVGMVDQEGKVRDRMRTVVGRVNEEGIIRRDLTAKLGRVDDEGNIYDHIGIRVGRAIMDADQHVEIEYHMDDHAQNIDPTETMSEVIHIVPVEQATISLMQIGAAALLLLFQSNKP